MKRRNFIFNSVPVCVERSGGTFRLKIGNGPWTLLQQCLDSTSLRQSFKDAVLNACNSIEEAERSGGWPHERPGGVVGRRLLNRRSLTESRPES